MNEWIAMCPGKLRTLNMPLKTLILDGPHVAMMLFLIMQKSIKFALSLYTPHKEIIAKYFHFYMKMAPGLSWVSNNR